MSRASEVGACVSGYVVTWLRVYAPFLVWAYANRKPPPASQQSRDRPGQDVIMRTNNCANLFVSKLDKDQCS